jgi:hypothetical protein
VNFQSVKIFPLTGNISSETFFIVNFAAFYADVPADRDRKAVSGSYKSVRQTAD